MQSLREPVLQRGVRSRGEKIKMQVWAIWRTSVRYELEANQAVAGTIHGHAEGHESAWSESVQRT